MRLFFAAFLFSLQISAFCASECVIRKIYTISKMIELCKDKAHLLYGEHAIFKLENLSQDDFDALLGNIKSIDAVMEIGFSSAKELNFRQLEEYDSSYFTTSFHNNEYLETIGFPKLIDMDNFQGQMEIRDNPKLQELYFPAIEKILFLGEYGSNLTIRNNSLLKSIRMPTVKLFQVTELRIIENPSLETIEIYNSPKEVFVWHVHANRLTITGKLIIVDNESLKEFYVGNKDGKKNITIRRMEILRNRNLESIPIGLNNREIEMWIEGNPRMERDILEGLRRLAKTGTSRIQDYGECAFNGPVMDLTVLDDCVYVYGYLTLTPATRGQASVRLSRVEGDVYVSDLSIDRLDFLLDTDIFGKFESALCDLDFSPFKSAHKGVRKSCTTTERTTTRRTTMARETTRRSTTRATSTAETTTNTTSTEGREETIERTDRTEEMERSTVEGMTEETTREDPSTESSTELTKTIDERTKLPLKEDKKEKGKTNSNGVIIACIAVVLIVIFTGLGIFLWKRNSKKKNYKLKREELSKKSDSGRESTSSQSSRQ